MKVDEEGSCDIRWFVAAATQGPPITATVVASMLGNFPSPTNVEPTSSQPQASATRIISVTKQPTPDEPLNTHRIQ